MRGEKGLVWRIETIVLVKVHVILSVQLRVELLPVQYHMITVVVRLAVLGNDQLVPGNDVDGLRGGGAGGGAVPLPQVLSQVQLAGGERGGRQLPGGLSDVLDQRGGAGQHAPGRGVFPPLVHGPSPGVHEEVGHCGWIETELTGDGDLHLLGRSFSFLKSKLCCRLDGRCDALCRSVSHWSLVCWSSRLVAGRIRNMK